MITPEEIHEIRKFKGLSLNDVSKYCNVSAQLIGQIENRQKNLTEYNYAEIIKGINLAYAAIQSGELVKGEPFPYCNIGKSNRNKNKKRNSNK